MVNFVFIDSKNCHAKYLHMKLTCLICIIACDHKIIECKFLTYGILYLMQTCFDISILILITLCHNLHCNIHAKFNSSKL